MKMLFQNAVHDDKPIWVEIACIRLALRWPITAVLINELRKLLKELP